MERKEPGFTTDGCVIVQSVIVYAVVDDALSPEVPLGELARRTAIRCVRAQIRRLQPLSCA